MEFSKLWSRNWTAALRDDKMHINRCVSGIEVLPSLKLTWNTGVGRWASFWRPILRGYVAYVSFREGNSPWKSDTNCPKTIKKCQKINKSWNWWSSIMVIFINHGYWSAIDWLPKRFSSIMVMKIAGRRGQVGAPWAPRKRNWSWGASVGVKRVRTGEACGWVWLFGSNRDPYKGLLYIPK